MFFLRNGRRHGRVFFFNADKASPKGRARKAIARILKVPGEPLDC